MFWEFDGISDWINRIYDAEESLSLRLESVPRQSMAKRLLDKSIDVSITSEPPRIDNLQVSRVRDFQLQLVTREQGCTMDDLSALPLVFLDWGTRFSVEHSRISELQKTPVMHTHSSRMALEYLLSNRSVGFLPSLVIAQSVEHGELYPIFGGSGDGAVTVFGMA